MKKNEVDFIVGASIIVAIIILITGVLWLKEISITRRMASFGVIFPNVGTLQVGDPVMVNGVVKGRVKNIFLRDKDVVTIIDLEKSVKLTDSCKIAIQNIGLMGERGIGIYYSDRGRLIEPIKKGDPDTTFIRGNFDTGIAEAMGMLGSVLGEVITLLSNLSSIINETVGDSSFVLVFKTLVGRLDTISFSLHQIVKENRDKIDKSIENLKVITEEAKSLVNRNTSVVDTIFSNGKMLSSRLIQITDEIDTITASIKRILASIESEESTLGMMLKDKQMYTELKRTITDIDTLVRTINEDALKLRIRFGFGKTKKRN